MEPGNKRLRYLFDRYYQKTGTAEERAELLDIISNSENNQALLELIREVGENSNKEEEVIAGDKAEKMLFHILNSDKGGKIISIKRNIIFRRIAVAASFLLIAVSGYFIWNSNNNDRKINSENQVNVIDFNPGSDGAVLTLGNGEQIVLDSTKNGTLALQGNTSVLKKNGQIIYEAGGPDTAMLFNTLSTPRGRQYNLMLADGSRVWLNAASSITYPIAFKGEERKISVTGEAYFEVAHNPAMPFRVSIVSPAGDAGEIEVLGTNFNINSYEDEAATKTTLLQGKVKVSSKGASVFLEPGQQAQISAAGKMSTLQNVDVDEVMAWKNGYFEFNDADIKTVMRQLARWYDVEVVYLGNIPKLEFGGKMQRDLKLSQVLKILDKYGVHFKTESGKIIVSK